MTVVAIINESTVLQDDQVRPVVGALLIQVGRDFAPEWGASASLLFTPRTQQPPAGAWQLVILDDSDQAGDLGYHELTSEGLPLGKVFARTDQSYGLEWSVTASHELLEMLADPWLNQACYRQTAARRLVLWPQEVCDPVEDDQFSYEIQGVRVSDFVLPTYFHDAVAPGTRLDFQGALSAVVPALTAGGYIAEFDGRSGAGWIQRFGEHSLIDRSRLARERGRFLKRMLPRELWQHSTRAA